MKNLKNILKNTSRFIQSNGVKKIQIWVHLVFGGGIGSSTEKENENKFDRFNF
jgi:hypothetical protein